MVPKKVGSITLEYDPGDGNLISEAFDAEFHNALITGDISALEGTFQGRLDVNAIDAVSRLNIAGRAVAVTQVFESAGIVGQTEGFNDDGVYRTLMAIIIEVPYGNGSGCWADVMMQYHVVDYKGDENAGFPCQYRILLDGVPYFTSIAVPFGNFFNRSWDPNFIHHMLLYLSAGQNHTVAIQFRWFDRDTNVYPRFSNRRIRVDIIRK